MKTGIYGSRILLWYEKENTRRTLKGNDGNKCNE